MLLIVGGPFNSIIFNNFQMVHVDIKGFSLENAYSQLLITHSFAQDPEEIQEHMEGDWKV